MTGSSGAWWDLPAICFIDGKTANAQYGVPIRTGGPCPQCKFPISQILSYNFSDEHYYLAPCPVCGSFIRYCDIDGNLSDLIIVTSQKVTEIDQELPDDKTWCGTF